VKPLALTVISTLFAACSTIGEDFDLDRARQIRNGMTREEVIALMGSPPSDVEGGDHGKLIWLFSSANSLDVHLKRVSFSFDDQGKLYGIPKEGVMGLGIDKNHY
jgi:outer membrane protein assembly factor BamE (lipoprotein component of BamABCDE complex)